MPILKDPSKSWERPAYTQVVRGPVGMGYSVRYGDWRYTQWGENGEGGLELYNVIKDREGYYNYAKVPEYAKLRDELFDLLKKGYPKIQRGIR